MAGVFNLDKRQQPYATNKQHSTTAAAMKTGAFQSGNAANSNPENTKPSADLSAGRALLINVEGRAILSGVWLVACFGSRKARVSSELAPPAAGRLPYGCSETVT